MTDDTEQLVSRRNYLLGGATLLGGVGILTLTSRETRAEVAMDTLDISGDSAELSQPPSAVTLTVSGSWTIDGPAPEQARVILQIEANSTNRDMAEMIEMDTPKSGDYTLEASLLDHPEIVGKDLLPTDVGKSKVTEIVVRVILLAINGGSIESEAHVEDAVSVQLTKQGLTLSVNGTGSISIIE